DLRLVDRIGELARKRREQEEGKDEQAAGDRAERSLLLGLAGDAVNHQQHHRGAEEIVVEGAQELRREDRQETPGTHQMKRILHQPARWELRNKADVLCCPVWRKSLAAAAVRTSTA